MDAEGLSLDWYVHRHRTEHEVLPWDHLTAGLHKDFLWGDWQAALAGSRASRTAAGRPATTAACAPATRIEHVVASPVPPAGGSQGTGQDLARGGEIPVTLMPRRPVQDLHAWSGTASMKLRFRVHQARQDPVHQPPRHRPRVGAGAAPGRAARWRTVAGLHTPAQDQLRPRPADRRRVDRRIRRRRARRRSRQTSTCSVPALRRAACPLTARCPTVST